MSLGKRFSTDEPLTEHDIADRLDKAGLRVWRIMLDVRQISPEFFEAVRGSRYLTNVLMELYREIGRWFPSWTRDAYDVSMTSSETDSRQMSYADLVTLTSYMAEHDYPAKDIAYAVEKPWKFVDVLAEAKTVEAKE